MLDAEVAERGSLAEAQRWVFPPDKSMHVQGLAIDVGDGPAADWLADEGARFGLCHTLAWEWWHFEWRERWEATGACPAPAQVPDDAPPALTRRPRLDRNLAHVHVLGFQLEQLGERFGHRLEAASEVEPHGVSVGVAVTTRRIRCGRSHRGSHRRLPMPVGEGRADHEVRQLRDPRPEVWHDGTDASQPFAGDATERDPVVMLEHVDLGLDGCSLTVRVPRPTSSSCRAAMSSVPCWTY